MKYSYAISCTEWSSTSMYRAVPAIHCHTSMVANSNMQKHIAMTWDATPTMTTIHEYRHLENTQSIWTAWKSAKTTVHCKTTRTTQAAKYRKNTTRQRQGNSLPKSQCRPDVVTWSQRSPTGTSPHQSPTISLLMSISCLPYREAKRVTRSQVESHTYTSRAKKSS